MDEVKFPDPFNLKQEGEVQLGILVEFRIRALAGEILEKPE